MAAAARITCWPISDAHPVQVLCNAGHLNHSGEEGTTEAWAARRNKALLHSSIAFEPQRHWRHRGPQRFAGSRGALLQNCLPLQTTWRQRLAGALDTIGSCIDQLEGVRIWKPIMITYKKHDTSAAGPNHNCPGKNGAVTGKNPVE
jgi:hypothetical protein